MNRDKITLMVGVNDGRAGDSVRAPLHSQRADAQAQGGVPQQPREHLDLPVNIEAPIQPIPVKGTDGKWYLVYHLFLTNWSFSDLTLKSVEVSDGEHGKTLTRYEDKEL